MYAPPLLLNIFLRVVGKARLQLIAGGSYHVAYATECLIRCLLTVLIQYHSLAVEMVMWMILNTVCAVEETKKNIAGLGLTEACLEILKDSAYGLVTRQYMLYVLSSLATDVEMKVEVSSPDMLALLQGIVNTSDSPELRRSAASIIAKILDKPSSMQDMSGKKSSAGSRQKSRESSRSRSPRLKTDDNPVGSARAVSRGNVDNGRVGTAGRRALSGSRGSESSHKDVKSSSGRLTTPSKTPRSQPLPEEQYWAATALEIQNASVDAFPPADVEQVPDAPNENTPVKKKKKKRQSEKSLKGLENQQSSSSRTIDSIDVQTKRQELVQLNGEIEKTKSILSAWTEKFSSTHGKQPTMDDRMQNSEISFHFKNYYKVFIQH